MAGSLKTTNYQLAKYAPDDITSWLTDFNGNMDLIDAGMQKNKQAATQAQDGVDSLEAEYSSLLQTVNGHTTSIVANEKAIAANTASIAEIEDDVNAISINDIISFTQGSSNTTTVEPLVSAFSFIGRRIGNYFAGAFSANVTAGTFHVYDREAEISGANRYITDLVRLTGNPFNLASNIWSRLCGFYANNDGSSIYPDSNIVIAYIPDAGYTVVGYMQSTNTAVVFSKNALVYECN